MSSMSRVIMALATGASLVSAHGYVSVITIDGTEFAGYPPSSAPYENPAVDRIAWSDTATDNGYVAPDAYASGDIICHRGAENAALTATVAAGGTVSLQWNTWPESHHGPVINYLADCGGDCTTVDKTTLEFFKIAESGLIDETTLPGTWASDVLLANNLTQTITIPSTLKAGSYVLRHEIIALHSAGSTDGAQNYPQCINLEVTGSGTELPAGTLGTALYTEEDAGILVNIYQTLSTYEIPGPTLAFSDSAATGVASASSASATTTSTVSKAAAATTTSSVSKAAATTTSVAAADAVSTTASSAVTTSTSTSSGAAKPTKVSCNARRHARDVKN